MRVIIRDLGDRLSLFQAQMYVFDKSVMFSHVLSNGGNPDLTRIIRAQAWRVPALHHSKQCIFEDGVKGCIVDVLRPRKPTNPLPSMVSCHASEVHANRLVHHLHLAICWG